MKEANSWLFVLTVFMFLLGGFLIGYVFGYRHLLP